MEVQLSIEPGMTLSDISKKIQEKTDKLITIKISRKTKERRLEIFDTPEQFLEINKSHLDKLRTRKHSILDTRNGDLYVILDEQRMNIIRKPIDEQKRTIIEPSPNKSSEKINYSLITKLIESCQSIIIHDKNKTIKFPKVNRPIEIIDLKIEVK